jgi:hypothetical protein
MGIIWIVCPAGLVGINVEYRPWGHEKFVNLAADIPAIKICKVCITHIRRPLTASVDKDMVTGANMVRDRRHLPEGRRCYCRDPSAVEQHDMRREEEIEFLALGKGFQHGLSAFVPTR